MDLLNLLERFGLPVIMVLWFMRRDSLRDQQIQEREHRLTSRLENLEDHQRTALEKMASDMISVLSENTKALKDVYRIIHHCETRRVTEEIRRP